MNNLTQLSLRSKIIMAVLFTTITSLVISVMFFIFIQQMNVHTLDSFSTVMNTITEQHQHLDGNTVAQLSQDFEFAVMNMSKRMTIIVLSVALLTVMLNMIVVSLIIKNSGILEQAGAAHKIENMSDPELGQVLDRVSRTLRSRGLQDKGLFSL